MVAWLELWLFVEQRGVFIRGQNAIQETGHRGQSVWHRNQDQRTETLCFGTPVISQSVMVLVPFVSQIWKMRSSGPE